MQSSCLEKKKHNNEPLWIYPNVAILKSEGIVAEFKKYTLQAYHVALS